MDEIAPSLQLRCLLLALAMTLAACQQSDGNLNPTPEPGPKPIAAAVQPMPETQPAQAAVPEPIVDVAQPADEPEPPPLNLDVPADILGETANTGFPEGEGRFLPKLFGKAKKPGRTVSPELLFKEGEDVSLESVSGGKITINIPVD